MRKPNIAILGATGVVGREITKITEELNVEFNSIKFLSSARSAGTKLTFKNKPFMRWCLVNCCSFFGLQMFLVAMNAMILGSMNMNGTQMAILNTSAFAPVPVMLYLFNKLIS